MGRAVHNRRHRGLNPEGPMLEQLRSAIRDVPDYPKPGIVFKDITTVLQNPELYRASIELMAEPYRDRENLYIAGVEARGFIFGGAIADRLGAGFVPVRKAGKLPWKTHSVSYSLEYGEDTLQIHVDALPEQAEVVIVDDLLATGGTVGATIELLETAGARVIGAAFLVELGFLEGRKKLGGAEVHSVLKF